MHDTTETPAPGAGLGIFERWLTLWVAAAILLGTALGRLLPDLFALIARLEYASVNIVVGVLIWVTIFPMMVGVDFSSFGRIRRQPRGLTGRSAGDVVAGGLCEPLAAQLFRPHGRVTTGSHLLHGRCPAPAPAQARSSVMISISDMSICIRLSLSPPWLGSDIRSKRGPAHLRT